MHSQRNGEKVREEEGEGKGGKERVKEGDEGKKCVWEEKELQDRRVRDTWRERARRMGKKGRAVEGGIHRGYISDGSSIESIIYTAYFMNIYYLHFKMQE